MKIKAFVLLGALTGLVLGTGYYFGGQNGLIFALILAAIMNIGSYWFSDKIVLAMYHAKPASAENYPALHAIVSRLASQAELPMPKLYIVPLPIPNAFATGRNERHAVVAVTPGILQILDEEEL